MNFGSKLPPDLNPIASEDFRRARKGDYDRKLRKRELERMADGGARKRSAGVPSVLTWGLGSAVAGFLGVAIGDVLALGAPVMLASVVAAGVGVGAVPGARARGLGFWPPVGLAIGVASVGPVYLLIGRVAFPGDAWFASLGLLAVVALIGYGLGRWRTRTRA